MRDIPVALNGFRLTVVEAPEVKQKRDGSGPVTDRSGATQFVVSLFVKQRPVSGQRTPKGEEIRVTLASDPGEGFGEGEWVELIPDPPTGFPDRSQLIVDLRLLGWLHPDVRRSPV